jgi:protein-arginine kinase activator protein McsA
MKCEKCKKNTNLVIISPQNKDLILKCENCKYEKKIERDKYNEVMFGVQKVYNHIIAKWWVAGEVNPKDVYALKLSAFDGIVLLKVLENQRGDKK